MSISRFLNIGNLIPGWNYRTIAFDQQTRKFRCKIGLPAQRIIDNLVFPAETVVNDNMAFAAPFVLSSPGPYTSITSLRSRKTSCPQRQRAMISRMSSEPDVPDVLKDILARKTLEVDKLQTEVSNQSDLHPLSAIISSKGSIEREKKFFKSLDLPSGSLTVIAEIKRRSPSKGYIGTIKNPGLLSRIYREGGASAISVLTDYEGFGGSMEDLRAVVKTQASFKNDYPGPCPVLRKEFIIDEIQIAEARSGGASAVLLIVAALGKTRTKELLDATHAYGLDALVEVHNEKELDIALEVGAEIVGVNNRDLHTFEVDLQTSFALGSKIPDGVLKVAESGISDCLDAWRLRDAGFNAILVGETLVKASEDSSCSSTSYTVGYNQAKGYIKAFRAKGSVEFGGSSSAAFFGQGEGASESLGELAM